MRSVVLTLGDGSQWRVRAFDPDDEEDGWSWPTLATDWRRHVDERWQVVDVATGEPSEVNVHHEGSTAVVERIR